jgi:hypothetical protein
MRQVRMRVIERMGGLGQCGSMCILGIKAKTAVKLMHLNFISMQGSNACMQYSCIILHIYCIAPVSGGDDSVQHVYKVFLDRCA